MTTALLIQFLQIYASLLTIAFVIYYFWRIHGKEQSLDKREKKIDSEYHRVVDDALSKERKILDDASHQANQIIAGAHYINEVSRETVQQALQAMVNDIQKETKLTTTVVDATLKKTIEDTQREAHTTARQFIDSYQTSLQQLAAKSLHDYESVSREVQEDLQKSLTDFQHITKGLEMNLQAQLKEFHETMLPSIEKEIEAYKQMRLEQSEKTITNIVHKVSQEVLNKSISLADHQTLLLASLEKAKKEGMFD